MTPYIRNRNCQCVRCRSHSLMGAAVLITLGVLFLMENYDVISFDRSFPVLLLVIGGVLLIARTGSTEGHIQPGWIQPPAAGIPPQPWTASTVPPPSPSQVQPPAENPPTSDSSDSQVKP